MSGRNPDGDLVTQVQQSCIQFSNKTTPVTVCNEVGCPYLCYDIHCYDYINGHICKLHIHRAHSMWLQSRETIDDHSLDHFENKVESHM